MDKYEVVGMLGEGSFGRVYRAKQISDGKFVALKVISKRGRSTKELKGFRRECEIQRDLHHPNIIQMLDSFETENEIVVITEYAQKELNVILGKEGYLSEDRVRVIVWDLVSALYYLHSNRVLHRDLKPQNILLDNSNRAKLCDFGFARVMSTGTHVLTSIKGTPLYMAPELYDEQPYDYNADLWSLGCIIYELLVGAPPFCTPSILHLIRLIHHEQIQWPTFVSDSCVSFLKGLLQKNPAKRFVWDQILNHPFVKGHILICKNTSNKPLTKPLTDSSFQAKEQQKKDHEKNKSTPQGHNKSTTTKSIEASEQQSDNKKTNGSKSSKQSQQSFTFHTSQESVKKSNSQDTNQDIKNNNSSLDNFSNLSLDTKSNNTKSNEKKRIERSSAIGINEGSTKKSGDTAEGTKSDSKTYIHRKLSFVEDNRPIETEEWIVFLQRSIQEVMNGEMMSLTQCNLTNIIVAPLRNINSSSKVTSFVARLLSIPFVLTGTTDDIMNQIKKVYIELKLVPNLVYSAKLLLKEKREDTPVSNSPSCSESPLPSSLESYRRLTDLSDDDFQSLEYTFLLISHLVHIENEFLLQFCDSVVVLNIYVLLKLLLLLTKRKLRIVLDVIAILTQVIRKYPENIDLIEKMLLNESNNPDFKQINFVDLLRHVNPLLRERTCYFLYYLCLNLPQNTIDIIWNDDVRDTLEALMFDSIESVRNAAEQVVDGLRRKEFYNRIDE